MLAHRRNHRNDPTVARGALNAVPALVEANAGGTDNPAGTDTKLDFLEALGLLAKHVAFIQSGERAGRNRVALDLVVADIDRVLTAAGMQRRVDDRGDEWAELNGDPVMWLGHRPELGRSAVRP